MTKKTWTDQPTLDRRALLRLSAGAAFGASLARRAEAAPAREPDVPAPLAALQPMPEGMAPVSLDEHRTRLARAQHLMAEAGLQAIVVGPGTSLRYFTGAQWGASERFFGMVLRREGEPSWVTPA